ncbi:fasciclin domain-containing protein [Mycetocola tolaasinivorans]|uniref:Fasciclin domain-containing protein n=1 Tax=Mycetocola tolaasinivorans TaxID=76635 RepID=A0A3L7AAL4_9MICO|nr:fasciclin domain-containing protein [Mycetocola tolaasinivorans]RLP76372.1 fasciclin domain-containing protein [Mycetocola tolaasinivorans]
MKTRNALFTATTLAALSIFALTGCSASSAPSASPSASNSASSEKPSATPSATPDAALTKNLVGPGCAAYAEAVPSGAGSIVGMAQDPVAVAASNNPLLKTLVAAVSGKLNPKVNLVDTLNGSEFTVFAPVDDAFAKIDAGTIDTLKTDDALLTKILTYHVVPGQILPDQIDGTHKTVEGQDLTVTGSGNDIKVGGASVICGGVKTANATVYLVDSVLMPPM